MSITTPPPAAATPDAKSASDGPDAWPVLEKLLLQLGDTTSTNQAVAHAVEAARVALGADVAYWFSKSNGKVSGLTAKKSFTAETAAALAKAFLGRMADGTDTLRWVKPAGATTAGQPEAAVVVADGRTQGCIVVLSFTAARRFDDGDTKVVRLALKMLLSQRAQGLSATKTLLNGMLQSLTTIMDAKDPYTAGHSERVARIAVLLVRQMGLPAAQEGDVYLAGLLHDVGNIGVPDQILHRPKRLTPDELEDIRRHAVIGEKIVASIRPFDRLRPVVRHHHEHYNGAGYPDGLIGEAIPLLARVLAVADACDAMMSARRYRAARSPYEIDAVFNAESGGQFDPKVVQAFMAVRHEIYPPIYQKGIGESAFHAIGSMIDDLADGSAMDMPVVDEDPIR